MQGGRVGGLEACLGWVAAARRAGSPGAAQCKSSLTTRPSMEVVELLPLIWATLARSQSVCPWEPYGRGSSGHIRGGMASNPHTMNTRENQKRASCERRRGRRWTLLAVPVGAGGRPPSVGIGVTSSFSWAGSGVLGGCEVGADRRKNWFIANNPSLAKNPFTDTCGSRDCFRALRRRAQQRLIIFSRG